MMQINLLPIIIFLLLILIKFIAQHFNDTQHDTTQHEQHKDVKVLYVYPEHVQYKPKTPNIEVEQKN